MVKYNLVLFDADGTLFDYDKAEGIALKKALEHYKFNFSEEIRNRYREINSNMWNEFEKGRIDKVSLQTERFKRFLGKYNLCADACDFNSVYLDFLANSGYLINGAVEVCRELSQYCVLAIATNGISKTQKFRLKNSEIAPFISHIIVSEDAGYQKPQTGFFEYAFNICGCHNKDKAIIIGDSLNTDIKAV